MEKEIIDKLVIKAREASERAYCPYTETPVGACVLTKNGMVFTGCNIENITLGNTFGALEVAVCKAISEGGNFIIAGVICCDKKMIYPSGSERQFLREFGSRSSVICVSGDKMQEFSIQELLPFAVTNDE